MSTVCPLPSSRLDFHALFANSSFYWHDTLSVYLCHIIILCHIPLLSTFHITLSVSCIKKQQAKLCRWWSFPHSVSHSFIHNSNRLFTFFISVSLFILFHSHLHSLYSSIPFILLFHTLSLSQILISFFRRLYRS